MRDSCGYMVMGSSWYRDPQVFQHSPLLACLVVTPNSPSFHAWLGLMAHHFTPPCMLDCQPKLLACMFIECFARRNGPPFHPSLHAWLSPQTLLAYMLGEAKLPTISTLLACLVVTPNSPSFHAWLGLIAHHFTPPCMLDCQPKLSLLVCLLNA